MEQKRTIVSTGALTEEEKSLTIEERDKILIDEMKSLGFLRDFRLLDKKDIPYRGDIRFEFDNGTIKFTELPNDCDILIFAISEEKVTILDNEWTDTDLKFGFPGRDFIRIPHPTIGTVYDLKALANDPSKVGFSGKGKRFYCDTIPTRHFYEKFDVSAINVMLLRDGYVYIEFFNMDCNSISFKFSEFYQNCLDVAVNTEPQLGELCLPRLENRTTIYHPILWLALSSQASIGVIDRNEGIFYAHSMFYFVPEAFGKNFVDINKAYNTSVHEDNLRRLTSLE